MEMGKKKTQSLAEIAMLGSTVYDIEKEEALDRLSQYHKYRYEKGKYMGISNPVLTLAGNRVATKGNLVALSGKEGSAKSNVLSCILASCLVDSTDEIDLLGFESPNPGKKPVIYIDTEQSKFDFNRLMDLMLKRARLQGQPSHLHAFCFTGEEPVWMQNALTNLVSDLSQSEDGIHSIMIDGFSDFLSTGPNDERASIDLTRWLLTTARNANAPVIGVQHLNAGHENSKMRGHLGSEIARRSETILTLRREKGGLISLSAPKTRGAKIEKQWIKWGNLERMFISASIGEKSIDRKKLNESVCLLDAVFSDSQAMSYSNLKEAIMVHKKLKVDAAKKWIAKLTKDGFIEKDPDTQLYSRTTLSKAILPVGM